MAETVVVIFDITKNTAPARSEHVRGKLFCRGLASASCDGDDRLVPFEICTVRRPLQCGDRIVYKDQAITIRLELNFVLFETILPNDTCRRSFFESRRNILRRIFKLAVKSVVL